MTRSLLLQLPQELRDSIYNHLFTSDDDILSDEVNVVDRRLKRLHTRHDRWLWDVHYHICPPIPTWLSLIRTNRQLRDEVTEHLSIKYRNKHPAARLETVIDYPNITTTWKHIPINPGHITTLDLLVKVDKIYHPCFISRPPYNAILHAVFEVLKSYISYGPHFSRSTCLPLSLYLETVRITLAPPQPLEDMEHIYGFPVQQLGILYLDFRAYVSRFARSTLPYVDIKAFEICCEGNGWERFEVAKEVVDGFDPEFFTGAGYKWRGPSEVG